MMSNKLLSGVTASISFALLSTLVVPNAEAQLRQVPGTKCDDIREIKVNVSQQLPSGLGGGSQLPITVKFRDYNLTQNGVHGCNYNVYLEKHLDLMKSVPKPCPAKLSLSVNTQPYIPRPWRSNNSLTIQGVVDNSIQTNSDRFGGVSVNARCRYKVNLKNNFMGIHMR